MKRQRFYNPACSYLPEELRNLLQAESALNDGSAFPYYALAMYLLKPKEELTTSQAIGHWFWEAWVYEVSQNP